MFETIEYLKSGNARQRQAYNVLTRHCILETLHPYNPLLVGTIPINIDIAGSDLDIICCVEDCHAFKKYLSTCFGHHEQFTVHESEQEGEACVVADFVLDDFLVEIFGQNVPTQQQRAYQHMIVEHKIIKERGEAFRQEIVRLKQQGLKTEPVFAALLGLKGDPYTALLNYYK